jgi:antirestriction protein ArdC
LISTPDFLLLGSESDKRGLVTDKIITLIKQGTCPWQKPWHSIPYGNLITKHNYQGLNPLLCSLDLMLYKWETPLFVSFYQAKQKGWAIKKGSKATWLRWGSTFSVEVEDSETGETRQESRNAGKWHNVFNIACLDDSEADGKIADYLNQHEIDGNNTEPRIEEAEKLIAKQNAAVSFGGDRACYSPQQDKIQMPRYDDFSGAEAYYATYFHELTHWTGHPTRLDRLEPEENVVKTYSSSTYAFEELVAELGAAFISNQLEITSQVENHASYLDSWLHLLKGDKKAFFKAVQKAQKATQFLMPEIENN